MEGVTDRHGERRDGAALDPNPEATSRATLPVSAPGPAGALATGRLAPGGAIKHYEILRELGQGGMGGVFLARDTRLARLCAIKLLRDHGGSGAGRFLAEARATASCKHENIVTIHEVDEIDGQPYMVLEYLEGRTLRAWMADQGGMPVPPGVAVELVAPVVRALVCAHEMGIVHRDLKPENIFVTAAGTVKVLDFGVAKRIGAGEVTGAMASPSAAGAGHTRQGALVGTLPYMAPEQWLGKDITPETDLWAVGIILCELVTGSHPLAPAGMPRLLEVQDLGVAMPSVLDRCPELGALGAVIDRCLNKPRSERIGSARELLAALAQPLSGGRAPSAVRSRRRRRIAGRAVFAIAGVAAVALGAAVVSAGGARSTGTAITDVALPASRDPAARAAYDAALHGFRDASWTIAEDQLRRAVALDPTLAPAHLRLAILLDYTLGRVPEARQSYALAVQWRAQLSERDRDILAAFEPLLAREPAELIRFTAGLAELGRRHPCDAEVLAMLAFFGTDGPEAQLRAARRAVEIDPAYADAWQGVGKQLFALGRPDEALRAFDACLAASPAAIDCLGERAQAHAAQGHCAAAEADLRNAVAANPRSRYWRDLQASALSALGKPVEAAVEVLTQKWATQPEDRRELAELDDRARLDLLLGHFDDARARLIALRALTRHELDADQHARFAAMRFDLATEAGDLTEVAEVAEIADDYLRRRGAWISASSIVDEIAMLTVLRDAGRLSPAEFDARRATWLASHGELPGRARNEVWLAAWVRPARTPEAAEAALAAAPPGDLHVAVRSLADHAALGTLLLRAGRSAEAARYLARAAHGCDGFLAPVAHVRAAAQLGQALEATGDRAGACAAYQLVLHRWGAAGSSVTVREAERRVTALGCAVTTRVTDGG